MSALELPSGQVPGGIQIFISYRRKDTAGHAGRLYDTLRARLDTPQIFMDIDAIEAGVDFVDVIHEAVGKCDVLLAVIGPDWLTLKNDAGERRIDEPGDFVRIEIEAALSRDVRVIPVLVDGGRMPSVAQLPASLATFGRRHALEISDARWGFDAGRLVESIEKIAVAKADEAARVAAAVVAAEAARVAAEAAAADAEAADAEAARLVAEAKAAEDARIAADSAAAEEARVAEEARLAAVAAAAAAAEHAPLAVEASSDDGAAAAAAAVALAAVGPMDDAHSIDPDAPTGTWPITATAATATARPPGGRNLPRYAAPIAAVLVLALGLGTVVLGAGVLGGGAQASPSQAGVASQWLPVPSGVYVAVAGDTLASVAGKFGVTTLALAAANPGLSRSDVLPVGQIVVVPASEPDPTVLPSSTPSESVAPSLSAAPSALASVSPSIQPTPKPTPRPTPRPTPKPTPKPTAKPTPKPTPVPNRKPVATPGTWCPLYNDRNTTLNVLYASVASDPDGDALSIYSWSDPNGGAGTLTKVTAGGKDALRYEPASGFSGTAQFYLTIMDSHELRATRVTHTIKVYSPIEQTGCG